MPSAVWQTDPIKWIDKLTTNGEEERSHLTRWIDKLATNGGGVFPPDQVVRQAHHEQ
jgi:hypothetical protein